MPVSTFTIDLVFENCFLSAMAPYVYSRDGRSLSIYGSECQIWNTSLWCFTITHTYCCVSKLSKFGAYLYSRVHNNTFLSEKFPVITSLYTFRRSKSVYIRGRGTLPNVCLLNEYFNFIFAYLVITYYSLQFLSNGDTK
jgi:hypothetical protein